MNSVFHQVANSYSNQNETKYFNKFTGKEDTIGTEPYFVPKKEDNKESIFHQVAKEQEPQEGWGKWALRTASQIPQGIAQAYTYPADLISLVGSGLAYDPNTIEELRFASERAGIPFNEEEYINAVQEVSQNVPTQSNIARGIENKTGIPLTPKTGFQKFANFASTAGTLAPKGNTFVGMNTSLPRPILGAGVAGVAETGKALGVPEPIADIASFGILKTPTTGAGSINIGGKKKPSGLPERGFESIKKEREVSQRKINQINKKVEKDFKEISNNIIADSEIGATKKELLNNPSYKNDTYELFNEAEDIASSINKPISKEAHSKEIASMAQKESSGYRKNEYQREYQNFMLDAQKGIESENISASQLLDQYRNNNQELTGYFESGRSKNFNFAKRDALLSENRAIANIFEKHYPESNLSEVFKAGNERWTKIKNIEMVEEFTGELFKEGVNYKKVNDFFNKTGYDKSFKRALGEKGYKQFEQLMKDLLRGEQGYKMLNVAKEKGFNELVKTGMYYILHPQIALTKGAFDLLKSSVKTLMNTMLDNPSLAVTYRKAVKDLKAGKFKEAEAGFKTLNEAVKPSEIITPKQTKSTPKAKEPIEVKAEPFEPVKPNTTKQDALNKFNERKSIKKSQNAKPTQKEAVKTEPKQIEYKPKEEIKPTKPKEKVKVKKVVSPDVTKVKAYEKQIKEIDSELAKIENELRHRVEQENWSQSEINNRINKRKALKKKREDINNKIDNFKNPKPKEEVKPTPESYFEKAKSNYNLSEKELVNETLKLKKELKNTKGNTSIIKDKKSDLRDAIELNEGIFKDIVSKRRKLESSLEEKTKANVNKFTTKDLKKQKDYILNTIDEALAKPTNKEFVEIKVPNDGTFKIYNIEDVLKQFQKKVKKDYPLKQTKAKL